MANGPFKPRRVRRAVDRPLTFLANGEKSVTHNANVFGTLIYWGFRARRLQRSFYALEHLFRLPILHIVREEMAKMEQQFCEKCSKLAEQVIKD